jgi:hypothetical protein
MAYVDENGRITDTPPDPTKRIKVSADSIEISVPKRVEGDYNPIRTGKVDFFNDSCDACHVSLPLSLLVSRVLT